jgi:hypothetical protein
VNSQSGIKFRSGHLKGPKTNFDIAFFIKDDWQKFFPWNEWSSSIHKGEK